MNLNSLLFWLLNKQNNNHIILKLIIEYSSYYLTSTITFYQIIKIK